jgi:hypothetical protein
MTTSIYIALILLLLLVCFCAYYFYLKEYWRAKEICSLEFSTSHEQLLIDVFRPYTHLSTEQKNSLKFKILYFLKFKNFWGIGDFEVSENMKVIIAAQACLLVLKQKAVMTYPRLTNIYISKSPYIEKDNPIDVRTMLPKNAVRLGESWMRGPLVLSWESVQLDLNNLKSGSNVVYHEFAHQLDGMDDGMDGTPILNIDKDYKTWQVVMSKNFLNLRNQVLNQNESDIDAYGATNEAEFFAVTVEEFFSIPRQFLKNHPDIYALYKDYFELDPAQW